MSLSERVQELNREISATVERALSDLRREVSQRLRTSSDEILQRLDEFTPDLPGSYVAQEDLAPVTEKLSAEARRGALGELRDSLATIDRARSQADILGALLGEAGRYASRAAVLLARSGEIQGWGGRGFGEADGAVRGLSLGAAANGAWGRFAQGQSAVRLSSADCAELCSRLEAPLPREGVLVPLVLRDRVAAVLYADRLDSGALTIEALQILAYTAAQAIESLPFRERAATPTLALEGEEPAQPAVDLEATAVEEPPAAAPETATEDDGGPGAEQVGATQALESAPEAEAYELPDVTDVPDVEAEAVAAPPEELEVEAEPELSSQPWTVEDEQAAIPAEEAEDTAETAVDPAPEPEPAWTASPSNLTAELPSLSEEPATGPGAMAAMAAEVPRFYPRSVDEPEPTAPVRLPEPSSQATVLLQRPNLSEAAEPEPAPPAPAPTAPIQQDAQGAFGSPLAAGGPIPEVRPPSGVDGPGWAFATTRVPVSPSDETLHEEARRLARLLVSEIKLYNEEQVEEGRRNRDLYERLKEDIDRSRQMYEERVDPRILRSTDYFYQELVRILASGDSKALGI